MNKKNKLILTAVCILLCIATVGGSFAWYLREEEKRAQTEQVKVMTPYNLYLMKPNATDTLQFAVGNLHPGETKQTVICVSNKRPADLGGLTDTDLAELARDSAFGYELMLVHTDNLAVDYTIYPLERHDRTGALPVGAIIMEDDTKDRYYWTKNAAPISGSDKTEEMREKAGTTAAGIVNAGTYWLSNDANMKLVYSAATGYKFDYYLVEIKWKSSVTDFDVYKKETDLVYVVANAKQPRPVEKND